MPRVTAGEALVHPMLSLYDAAPNALEPMQCSYRAIPIPCGVMTKPTTCDALTSPSIYRRRGCTTVYQYVDQKVHPVG
uniref:Uncharacterized protein n=1 Tax=Picea glauca TaxID=3330 RepID=A0A117NFS3_PICGL|nr:hypothetical protein ABT39_MTgene2456 [Picea glauca]QHR88525.1 hypothetical protein Q903MT_gene2539 [Picea sitchensis]